MHVREVRHRPPHSKGHTSPSSTSCCSASLGQSMRTRSPTRITSAYARGVNGRVGTGWCRQGGAHGREGTVHARRCGRQGRYNVGRVVRIAGQAQCGQGVVRMAGQAQCGQGGADSREGMGAIAAPIS